MEQRLTMNGVAGSEIMDEMDKGLFCYDNSQPLYSNKMRFLDVIMQYNLWGELWSKINK